MAVSRTELSRSQARRIALHAQGFGSPRPDATVDRRHVRKVFANVGLIQIDSVNVLVRSQELPLFARLGPHRRDLLPRMSAVSELFEYWSHEASLLPIDLWPYVRWRMDRTSDEMWSGMRTVAKEDPAYVESVYEEVFERGPIAVGELSAPGPKSQGMWGWSVGKKALEYLFWTGRITARRRTSDFARLYAVTEQVIPADVLARPPLAEEDAKRELLALSAAHLGIATERDLCDYHRLNIPRARPLIAELVEEGRIVPATVEGWRGPAYLHPDAHLPRWIRARALLSPFDSLIWDRSRTERLFDFRYRVEIYTPKHKRLHGYYVLPFLHGERLVARVDLKSDRQTASLLVQSAFVEPGCDSAEVADALAGELRLMAGWLDLESVTVVGRGDLSEPLVAAGLGVLRLDRDR